MNESIDYYLSDEEESLLLITVIGKRFTQMRFIADSDTLLDYRNYVDIKKNKVADDEALVDFYILEIEATDLLLKIRNYLTEHFPESPILMENVLDLESRLC